MRTVIEHYEVTEEYKVFAFTELTEKAKEKVRQWFIDDSDRSQFWYEDIKEWLANDYPKSSLDVCFSLGSCQGDGLNIYGALDMADYLPFFNCTDEERKQLEEYLPYLDCFNFEKNSRYCYSCKFLDKEYLDGTIAGVMNDLIYDIDKPINEELVKRFYCDMLEHFEQLDSQYEKDGYNYLYLEDNELLAEEASVYEYLEDGSVYC